MDERCHARTGGELQRFTPDRPPGAVDVSSSDTVAWTGTYNTSRLTGMHNGEQGYFKCLSLSLSCGRSTSTVNGQTRIMLTGDWIFVPSTGTTITTPDTDYLAGGIWLIVPDDATSADDYIFGAFADGNDPFRQSNLTTLQSTATYDGDATGLYSEKMSGSTIIGYFDGDVRLTANFDGGENDRGTIGGSITNFKVDSDSVYGRLDLGTANIGPANSGFFRGEVTGSNNDRNYNGHWGGQFFGNAEADGKSGSVAGTFDGRSTDNAVNFVGAFGAHKQ